MRCVILITVTLWCITGSLRVCAHDNPAADSLKTVLLRTREVKDRLSLFGKISWAYLRAREQLEEGRKWADSLRIIAQRIGDEAGQKRALYYYGAYERFRGNHAESIGYLKPYLSYATASGDSAGVADALFQLSVCQLNIGDYTNALQTLYRFMNICRFLNEPVNVAHAYLSIANIFFNSVKHEEALDAYDAALHIYDSLGKEDAKGNVYLGKGNVYTKLREFTRASSNYQRAAKIFEDYNMPYGVALVKANIAFMYDGMSMYDSALVYHLAGLRIRETLPNKDDLTRSLIGVGRGYKALGDFARAEVFLSRAKEVATRIESKPMLRDIYINLAELFEQKGQYRQAFRYLSLHKQMNDTIMNDESSRILSDLKAKYETESKNQRIALLEQQKELQHQENRRQVLITRAVSGGLILITLLGGALIYISRQRVQNQREIARKNEELREATFRRQLSELELKALRAQVNPHFLFNCMNSINRMILEGNTEEASRYLTKFAILVRQILENSETDQVPLANELAMLKAYIELEELRLKKEITCSLIVDEGINPDDTYIPPMILQPFVENAIWHGLTHRDAQSNGRITIRINENDDQLLCSIEDNGVGRERAAVLKQNSVWKSKSMGIKITEERLRFLSKEKLRELISVTDLKDGEENALGTRVDIHIPVN